MKLIPALLAAVFTFAIAGGAEAAFFPWGNASGTSPGNVFSWTDGDSEDSGLGLGEGLWGDPTVTDQGFFFNDMRPEFKAEATEPSAVVIESKTRVMITGTNPLTELHIAEWGTWTGAAEDVNTTYGSVTVTPLIPVDSPFNMPLQLNLTFQYTEVVGDVNTWSAKADIDLTQDLSSFLPGLYDSGVTKFQVTVTNHLRSDPVGAGETAMIQKVGGRIIVPEPATLLLGLGGLLAIALRRSR